MQYVLQNAGEDNYQRCNATFLHGLRDGVFYRRQFFDYDLSVDTHWRQALNLADFPVEYGIMRADKLRLFRAPVTLTLGAYGFPDNGTEIIEKQSGNAKAIILKGHDSIGHEKQLAMTIYDGWGEISFVRSTGTNPDSENSIVVYAKTSRTKNYGYENFLLVSQVITKESLDDFSDDVLFPIESIIYTDVENHGGYGSVTITLKNGTVKLIDFDGIEGFLAM